MIDKIHVSYETMTSPGEYRFPPGPDPEGLFRVKRTDTVSLSEKARQMRNQDLPQVIDKLEITIGRFGGLIDRLYEQRERIMQSDASEEEKQRASRAMQTNIDALSSRITEYQEAIGRYRMEMEEQGLLDDDTPGGEAQLSTEPSKCSSLFVDGSQLSLYQRVGNHGWISTVLTPTSDQHGSVTQPTSETTRTQLPLSKKV